MTKAVRLILGALTALTALTVVAALAPSPLRAPLRAELTASFTREPESFLELSFTDPQQVLACHRTGRRAEVSVDLVAHGRQSGRHVVEFSVLRNGRVLRSRTQSITAPRDRSVTVVESLRTPTKAHSIRVRVPGVSIGSEPPMVRVRCNKGASR